VNSANAFIRPRRLGVAAPFVFLLLAGCGDYSAYPEEVRYPLRTDPILQKPSEKEFVYPDPPGKLDEFLAERGRDDAKLLDPKTIPAVDPVKFRFTDDVRSNLKSDGVPDEVLTKLDALKGKDFASRHQFTAELTKALDKDELGDYRETILERAAKQPMDQATLRKALLEIFGTPAGPRVALPENDDTAVSLRQVQDLKLDTATLAEGSKLYRRYCMQCHGISGDGRGPTGPWLHPHPRDYRQGIFKFTSTTERKPRRDDLIRTLKTGVDGTSMPSFALLGDEALGQLVSYVMHLSIRGEVELTLYKALLGVGEVPDGNLYDGARSLTADFVKHWYDSDRKPFMTPTKAPPYDMTDSQRRESVARGYKYFVGTEGACIKCHIDYGRQVKYVSDDWGTLIRPRNLTEDNYRGGRRPIDLYWRIRGGIRGTKMAAGAGLMGPNDDDTKVWDVVNFVQALPYPKMLPGDVYEKVYGKKEESPHASAEK
jgi:mono/diheme cytochrome c family protein